MATENEQVSTNTGKKISDYTDYHKDEQGQTIADVSYFESDAVIPLSGKYAASDENPKTKSVKLSEVIGGGVSVVSGGGIEQVSNGSIQLKNIGTAQTGYVPAKTANGIEWVAQPTADIPPAANGGIEVKNSAIQLKNIDTAAANTVLTKTNDGVAWALPSAGGGLSRATATLYPCDAADWSQSVEISNNTYTKVTNKIDSRTEIVKIYLEQCDMPHAYVELETDGDDVESIPVFVGDSETNLRWVHPSYTFIGSQKVVVDGDEDKDWVMQIPSDATIIVEIIGNFINIHCNRATLSHDAGGGGD